MGFGAFAEQTICKGDYIGPYTGKAITNKKAEEILKGLGNGKATYLFKVKGTDVHGNKLKTYVLDGSDPQTRSWTRFINHSCQPNAAGYLWEEANGAACIVIMAIKQIEPGNMRNLSQFSCRW
jgi:SET domain-containing protein